MIGFLKNNRHIIHLLALILRYGFGFTPVEALDVLESLGNGPLKRHEIFWGLVIIHVFIQPDCFKRFVKVTDIYIFIPTGSIPE